MSKGISTLSSIIRPRRSAWASLGLAAFAWMPAAIAAQTPVDFSALAEQNQLLKAQLAAQQAQLDSLKAEVARLAKANEAQDEAVEALERRSSGSRGSEGKRVAVSGTGSLTYFSTDAAGRNPNGEFVFDEARLQIEAPIRKDTYFYGDLLIATREMSDETFHLGEIYVDFENAFGSLFPDRVLNVRAGRLNIPFGEEYQVRYAIDNPLISHSVTDFWGIDEGVEVYGEWQKFSYVFAVQNGGTSRLRDWNSDKALIARLGYQPTSRLHFSASAMRTGRLDVANEFGSEMWIGNSIFVPMQTSATATTFEADLFQLESGWTWHTGALHAAVGEGRFRDNDRVVDADQSFNFYQVEAQQTLVDKLYAAGRFSGLEFDRGYYLPGQQPFAAHVFGGILTHRLTRLSLGAGYRFSSDLNLKVEYSWEDGRLLNGTDRADADQLAAQLALRF